MRRSVAVSDRASTHLTTLFLTLVFAAGAMAVSCAVFNSGPQSPKRAPGPSTVPRARSTPTPTPTLAAGPESGFTERVNLDEFAPRGRGRDLAIMNCDYCHSWVCAVRGQRTLDHWVMVEDVHRGRGWVILSEDDWDTLFAYLEINFNDQKPQPKLPSAFQQAGCTHSTLR